MPGRSIGSSVEISMGSKEIVLNFLYSIFLGKGLLIRFFGSNIVCRTYYEFSKLRIATLNMVRKILTYNYDISGVIDFTAEFRGQPLVYIIK